MSVPQTPKHAKLVIGIITLELKIIDNLLTELASQFGQIDLVSPWMRFNYTTYYEPEMGSPLFRRMFAFKALISQGDLSEFKLATNQMENHYSHQGRRRVNIDPGYMLRERFVLASGKNFSHRIYIGGGIYADLTLIYHKGSFKTLPWTYPDYSDVGMLKFLEQVRNKYILDAKRS
jgi:hypothetical protein